MLFNRNQGDAIPFVPLSSYYFFYFAAVGIVIPYLGLYFQSLGLDAIEIAQLIAVLSLARIVAPPLWALLADRRGQFLAYVQLAPVLAFIVALGFWWFQDYKQLLWLVWWLGFFWHAALPPMESLTLKTLADRVAVYSRIRLWGSIGFIVSVLLAGVTIDRWGMTLFLVLMTLFFALTAFVAFINRPTSTYMAKGFALSGLAKILRQPVVWLMLSIAFFNQLSHGVYYAFYSILLHDEGFSSSVIGWLWSLGVLAEILLFWFFARMVDRFGFVTWLLVASVLTWVRWLMIAFGAEFLLVLVLAQLLHAASFALFHILLVQWLHQAFDGHLAQGQALYSSLTYGVGGVLGSLLAGYAWVWGAGGATFGLAAMASFVALCLVMLYRHQEVADK